MKEELEKLNLIISEGPFIPLNLFNCSFYLNITLSRAFWVFFSDQSSHFSPQDLKHCIWNPTLPSLVVQQNALFYTNLQCSSIIGWVKSLRSPAMYKFFEGSNKTGVFCSKKPDPIWGTSDLFTKCCSSSPNWARGGISLPRSLEIERGLRT